MYPQPFTACPCRWRPLATLLLAVLIGLVSPSLLAGKQDHDGKEKPKKSSVNADWIEDLREGKISLAGDDAAVDMLILQRHIPIPYDYIATLMRTPNAFGQGVACIICHSSNDPTKSYRGLDLSTCQGIRKGSTEPRPVPFLNPVNRPRRASSAGACAITACPSACISAPTPSRKA